MRLFRKERDFDAFERVMVEAMARHPIRLLGYCLMPTHWHFVLWPGRDGDMTAFLRWLTHTHSKRWQAQYHRGGSGHVYQGRFKSFPVEKDDHYFTLLRYVERNALRARLVRRAENWRWSSLYHRLQGPGDPITDLLHGGPLALAADWARRVNEPQPEAELEALRRSVNRGQPFGSEGWQAKVARKLDLEHTFRPLGRPKKKGKDTK
jgi:putative transposase